MAEYIDKEKLIADIVNTGIADPKTLPFEVAALFVECANRQNEILEIIERQPTAEVEPVRHGRYLRTGWTTSCECVTEIQCSECEETYLFDEIRLETSARYCPYCGVKWDGGADNG